MVSSALLVTSIALLALLLFLLGECRFLIPYRDLLFSQYNLAILGFAAALFANLFTAVYLICRKLFLKDTGRKLAHIEKQMRSGESLSSELSRYLEESR